MVGRADSVGGAGRATEAPGESGRAVALAEGGSSVKSPVVRRLLKLMEFRSSYPAFDGVFHLMYSNDSSVAMCWRNGELRCELFVDLNFKKAMIGYVDVKSKRWLSMRC